MAYLSGIADTIFREIRSGLDFNQTHETVFGLEMTSEEAEYSPMLPSSEIQVVG